MALAQSPLVYWRLNEAAGRTFADLGSAALTATLAGNTSKLGVVGPLLDDVTSGALDCTAATADLATTASVPTAAITNVTMMGWVYLSSASLNGCFFHNGTSSDGYGLGVGGTTMDNVGNNLIAIYSTVRWAVGTAIGTGWHHVALVVGSASGATMYVDGVEVYSDLGTAPVVPTTAFVLGAEGTAGDRHSPAPISEVEVIGAALTWPTIRQHYLAGVLGRLTKDARTVVPRPSLPVTGAPVGLLLVNNTTMYVGHVVVPEGISVKEIVYNVSAAAVGAGAIIRVAVYSEDGARKLIDVTEATGTNSGNRAIAISPSVLLPGRAYYACILLQTLAATTQPTILMHATDSTFNTTPTASQPVLGGTLVISGGIPPATIDPTAITAVANRVPYLRLTGDVPV